jgi:NDP-sugar pyrophosphorylase family protein
MKGLLLAAGAGTRLRPLTSDRPKPMVEIAGEPAVAHSLRWLRRNGVRDVAINLHHHGDVLRGYVRDGRQYGIRVSYSVEPEILGTSGALRPLMGFLQDEEMFAVLYGDVLTDLDLAGVIDAHRRARPDATVVLTRVDDPTRAGVVAFDRVRRVTRMVEKPAANEVFSNWANAGVYLCGPRVLDFVSAEGPQDFARHLFPAMLAHGCFLLAHPSEAVVIDFGSPERLRDAEVTVKGGSLAGMAVGGGC